MALQEAMQVQGWGKMTRLAIRLPGLLTGLATHPAKLALFLFGRIPMARRVAARLAARLHPADGMLRPERGQPLTTLDSAVVLTRLQRDGICTGLSLPPATVAAIRAYAESHVCYGGPQWNTPVEPWNHAESERRHGGKLLAANFPDTDQGCPAIAELIRNPWLHDIASGHLGARAQIIDLRLWWSFPAGDASRIELSRVAQDTFHFDLADWGQVKFFFYLTDVDAETGAHVYVRGSHAARPLSHQFTLFTAKTDAEIAAAFGAERIQVLTGSAGTGFVEDPFGYHTGSAIRRDRRLILEVSFGITGTTRRRDYGPVPG